LKIYVPSQHAYNHPELWKRVKNVAKLREGFDFLRAFKGILLDAGGTGGSSMDTDTETDTDTDMDTGTGTGTGTNPKTDTNTALVMNPEHEHENIYDKEYRNRVMVPRRN
jgi:hypothetical protein